MNNDLVLDGKSLRFSHTQSANTPKSAKQAATHAEKGTPGVLFCGGFRSDMQGTKALYLQQFCDSHGLQYTRFDYQGHGASSGEFIACGIGDWRADTLDILDHVCLGPQIIIGSSMGLWMALLATLARPERVNSIIGIAGAPDFTERLIWQSIDADLQARLMAGEIWNRPSGYDDGSAYPIGMKLIDSGRPWLLLGETADLAAAQPLADDHPKFSATGSATQFKLGQLPIACPVRLLHGSGDVDVPWQLSGKLLSSLASTDAHLTLVKDADHRLSSPQHLQLLETTLVNLLSH